MKKTLLLIAAFAALSLGSTADVSAAEQDRVFTTPTVFGRVFLDANNNGEYDEGEEGVGGVKLLSIQGEAITTDTHGRYSLPIIVQRRGNYVLKLDKKSLPQDYRVTTDNPASVYLTSGMPAEINFGVAPKKTKAKADKPTEQSTAKVEQYD